MRPAKSALGAIPESMIATPTPPPVGTDGFRKAKCGRPRVSRSVFVKGCDGCGAITVRVDCFFALVLAAPAARTVASDDTALTQGLFASSSTSRLCTSPLTASMNACSPTTASPWRSSASRTAARHPGLTEMMICCVFSPVSSDALSARSTFEWPGPARAGSDEAAIRKATEAAVMERLNPMSHSKC